MKTKGRKACNLFQCRLIAFMLVLMSLHFSLFAEKYHFTNFNTSNSGLSYDTVQEICQSRDGFVWLGTSSGLSRYDGRHFRSYDRNDFGLNTDFVVSLCVDDSDNLFVGTDEGLCIYDRHLDRFHHFTQESNLGTVIRHKVNSIRKGPDSKVWLSVNSQGLFSFDPEKSSLTNYFVENGRQTLSVNIRSFCLDSDGSVYIALYYNGLYSADLTSNTLSPVLSGKNADFFAGDDINSMLVKPGDDNVIYLASVRKGLCEVNVARNEVTVLIPSSRGFYAEDLFIDSDRNIWMGTSDGVYVYNTVTGDVEHIMENQDDKFGITDKHVFAVFVDCHGCVWIGTNVGGVNYFGVFQRNFEKYYTLGDVPLGDCLVRGFTRDDRGNLWVCTEKSGLLKYDISSRKLERFESSGLPKELVSIQYHAGRLWLGSMKGLCRLDPVSGNVRMYTTLEHSSKMKDSKVYTLYEMRDGSLLAGTTLGLLRYDDLEDAFIPLKSLDGQFITDVVQDRDGTLWASTYAGGLFHYDPLSDKLVERYVNDPDNPLSIPSNKLFSVEVDSKSRVWAASFSGGFFMLDPSSGVITTYNTGNCPNLPGNIFFEVKEDLDGKIWVSSDKGLISLDPETSEIARFTESDGLLDNEFKNCGFMTEEGDIYLGSKHGFIRFNPRRFIKENTSSKVLISDFRIGDNLINPGMPDSPVDVNINEVDEISLMPRQNSFGFGFAMPESFQLGTRSLYCRLAGYESEWRRLNLDNCSVFYYNVPSGTYHLQIMVGEGAGSYIGKELKITVASKFYRTPLAFLIYLLLIILVAYAVSYYFYGRALKREQEKQKAYKKAMEEQDYKDKMSFFSNILHEIKTPLTLIKTPLNNILSTGRVEGSIKEDLSVIENSTEYLDQLVKELLDFIKVEKHGWVMDLRPVDVVEKLSFLCFNFNETVKNNNVRLTFTHDRDEIMVDADEKALLKIFNNLMHNAVKYADSFIGIDASVAGDSLEVTFVNDGPEIPPERRTEIFKPFIQYGTGRQASGSFGIGLSLALTLARLHNGNIVLKENDSSLTEFVLTLPLHKESSVVEDVSTSQVAGDVDSEEPEKIDSTMPLIALVEDNRDLAAYLKRKLSSDYRVLTARNPDKGLDIVRHNDVDILITDIALGGGSGIDLCKAVAADFELSHIPIIVVSAISSLETKIECMDSGACLYIEKPFTMDYLMACIKSVLEKRRSLKKSYLESGRGLDPVSYNLVSADENFLNKLNRTIMDHISEPDFSSRQMEDELCISRSTLIRKVKALLGTTPNDYLRSRRLSVAAEMLSGTDKRVNEVCYAVGFNSPSWFARCFKEQYGVLPLDYRKSINDA